MTGKCHRCNIMKIRFTVQNGAVDVAADYTAGGEEGRDDSPPLVRRRGSNMFFDKLAAASDTKSSKLRRHPLYLFFIFFLFRTRTRRVYILYMYVIFFVSKIWISNFSLLHIIYIISIPIYILNTRFLYIVVPFLRRAYNTHIRI